MQKRTKKDGLVEDEDIDESVAGCRGVDFWKSFEGAAKKFAVVSTWSWPWQSAAWLRGPPARYGGKVALDSST